MQGHKISEICWNVLNKLPDVAMHSSHFDMNDLFTDFPNARIDL